MTAAAVVLDAGQLATLAAIDGIFRRWAREIGALEVGFGATIPVATLERAGYLRAFPHLATFAVSLGRSSAGLRAFASAGGRARGVAELPCTDPVRLALPPSACHHVYEWLRRRRLAAPVLVTTRATCFRREKRCEPLRRQRAFEMREIVCVGDEREVEGFLADARRRLDLLVDAAGLPAAFAPASDPFFAPATSAGYVMQRLLPLKIEIVVDGLAIGSLNRHGAHFGRAFEIRRGRRTARSACVAFGLERWLHVVRARGGDDPPWLAEATHG